jgi:hypothetical protein
MSLVYAYPLSAKNRSIPCSVFRLNEFYAAFTVLFLFKKKSNFQEWFIGRELCDKEPTIVHHFAFHHDPSVFKYPLGEAGIILSWPTVKR